MVGATRLGFAGAPVRDPPAVGESICSPARGALRARAKAAPAPRLAQDDTGPKQLSPVRCDRHWLYPISTECCRSAWKYNSSRHLLHCTSFASHGEERFDRIRFHRPYNGLRVRDKASEAKKSVQQAI